MSLERVRERYREVNGDHPMSPEDDCYVRAHFVEVPDPGATLDRMVAGELPLPSYLLADGTPMVPADYLEPAEWAGGLDLLRAWFLDHWPGDAQDTAEEEWAAYLSGQYVCLRSVTPLTIRRKAALVEQVRAAVAVLEQEPRDATARGSLGEATSKLDDLELPMTDYDRLRFGGPLSRETWIEAPRRRFLTPADPSLPVRTERLVLRLPEPRDAEPLFAYYSDPEVVVYLLTPPLDRREAESEIRRRMAWTPHAKGGTNPAPRRRARRADGRRADPDAEGAVVQPGRGRLGAGPARRRPRDRHRGGPGADRPGVRPLRRPPGLPPSSTPATSGPRPCASAWGCGVRPHKRLDYWSKGEWTDSFEYAVLADEWRQLP